LARAPTSVVKLMNSKSPKPKMLRPKTFCGSQRRGTSGTTLSSTKPTNHQTM
jgi:hypothetical protein